MLLLHLQSFVVQLVLSGFALRRSVSLKMLGRLIEAINGRYKFSTGTLGRGIQNKVQKVDLNYAIFSEETIVEILDTFKNKFSAVCSRLRRYDELLQEELAKLFHITQKPQWECPGNAILGWTLWFASFAKSIATEVTSYLTIPWMNFAVVTKDEVRQAWREWGAEFLVQIHSEFTKFRDNT